MHEAGLCEGVLEAALARAGDRRIASLRLRVGALHRVEQEAMQQALAVTGAGTVAEGARLELVEVPVRVHCGACDREETVHDPIPACPSCGSFQVELQGGNELILERLEYLAPET